MSNVKAVEIVGKNVGGEEAVPYLVEVVLKGDDVSAMFRRVRETLERIGVSSRKENNTLLQSCHILHKRGKYYITHFKTLFVLDGRENNLTEEDIARQNKIVELLAGWGMIDVVNPEMIESPQSDLSDIKVLKHHERANWTIKAKYRLGSSKTVHEPTEKLAA